MKRTVCRRRQGTASKWWNTREYTFRIAEVLRLGKRWRASLSDFRRSGVAVVIEAGELAQTICDFLTSFGYHAISAPTHAEAARRALEHEVIALLAAAVPAPDESLAGIYLEEAAAKNKQLAVVLMLSDPMEQSPGAPDCAVSIVKPFGRDALTASIRLSEAKAARINA